MYKLNAIPREWYPVFDIVSLYNGSFSGYIMYIVRCDCHMAIHLKEPKFSRLIYVIS